MVQAPSPNWANPYILEDRPTDQSAAMNTKAHGDGSDLSMLLPLIVSSCICTLLRCTNAQGV